MHNKDLKILNLSDVQITSKDVTENSDDLVFLKNTIRELIKKTEPDLITLSGDIAYGEQEDYLNNYLHFADFLESFGITWTLVWGNHDYSGGDEPMTVVANAYRQYPHFVFECGAPEMGNGNFVIGVREGDHTVSSIIMLDTHDQYPFNGKNTWAKLYPCQIKWYEEQMKLLESMGCDSNMIIMHIPIYAYREAFTAAFKSDRDPKSITYAESFDPELWNDGYKDSYGLKYEDICSYPEDEGMLDAILRYKKTSLVIAGHDHVNTLSITHKGVRLMYALKTGRGCYFNEAMNGGTLIKINSAGDISAEHIFVK